MNHTVIISDIHLCELEKSDGLWMRYRQAPYCPDQELIAMLGELRRRVRGQRLSLVLNGDIFDLDAPRVVEGESQFHNLPRSAEHAVPMMAAILDDHPGVVQALGEVLADGHTVVLISGNHDVQMTLPEVRALLQGRLVEAARQAGGGDGAEARVQFRAWFHRTEDGIVVEHGHQYDSYCSHRYPMAPFSDEPGVIQPTVGSLTARLLTSRMGFFNPHVESSFMLTAAGYAAHWARQYMLSKRSLLMPWLVGAVRTMAELLRVRQRPEEARHEASVAAAARETGVSEEQVRAHAALFERPAEENPARVLRELWLDRLALAGLAGALGATWLLFGSGAGAMAGAAVGPALFLGYEMSVPKPPLDETWVAVQRMARQVARVHGASAVIFGHTHHSEAVWEDGVFYGNSGSWSAAFRDLACTEPVEDSRPVLWLRSEDGQLAGGMMRWRAGAFEPG